MKVLHQWKAFSSSWKNAQRDLSESSVHDIRVVTRRLIAELELADAVTPVAEADSLLRRFNRILKRCSRLRDIQVHIENVERFGKSRLMGRFSGFLKQAELDECQRLRSRLRMEKVRSLHSDLRKVDKYLRSSLSEVSRPALRSATEEAVKRRLDVLMSAEAAYQYAESPEQFHRMRVKFKKYRYAAEAAGPVLSNLTRKKFDSMKKVQEIMGEIHDLENLRTELIAWAGDSGNAVAARIEKKIKVLRGSFVDRWRLFKELSIRV